MEDNLKQLMQRKQELLRIKRDIERSKPVLNSKDYSQNAKIADKIDDSDNEETKDARSVLMQTSESAIYLEDCIHKEIADTIEDSDTEGAKFDVACFMTQKSKSAVIFKDCSQRENTEDSNSNNLTLDETFYLTQKSHHSPDTINSFNSSAPAKNVTNEDNSHFMPNCTLETTQRKHFVVNSSSDSSDILNTSTICLDMTHSFFNDSSNYRIPVIDQSTKQEPSQKRAKINIVSVEKIDDLNAKLNERKYFELLSKGSLEHYDKDNLSAMPLKEYVSKYAININKTTNNDIVASNIPRTSVGKFANLDLPASSCANIKPLDLPSSCADITDLMLPAYPSVEFKASDLLVSPSADVVQLDLSARSDDCVKDNTSKTMSEKFRKRKRKEKIIKLKKEHVDYMSDDEVLIKLAGDEDFSSGSSELWSGKESDMLSDSTDASRDEKTKKKRKKLQKKRNSIEKFKNDVQFKKNKKENKRKVRRTKKEKGESYETSSGNLKAAKKLQKNPCESGKCPRNCFGITDERRQNIFNYFWNLDNQRKKDWLVQCAHRVPVKRPKIEVVENKRKLTFEYYINEGEGRRQVCQKFILKTLDITQNFLLYTLSNVKEGLSQEERRKKTTNSKYDETVIDSAKSYIESLPFLPSHYCRKDSSKLNLPQEYKNVTNLYRLYRKFCEEKQENYLGERKFKDFFKTEYNNITVHIPKKDKCKVCAKIENNSKEAEAVVDSEFIKVHNEEKEATYERFQCHQNMHSIDKDTLVSSFDLQKVLNTPHGDYILLFYSRKYTVYNFTVYESSTQNGFCYTWCESDGKRGAKEIGTCIYKYLQNIDERGIKKILFYCDCCSGQNRNKTIMSIFQYFLTVSKNIEVIQINYLLPGHSYMPVDSMHSVIEREVRKLTVWSPTQWPSYMESARKNPRPYNVFVLEHKDFIDWDQVTQKCFPSTKNLQMSKIRIATIKKKDVKTIKTKHSMKTNATTYEIKASEEDLEQNRTSRCKGKGKGKGRAKKIVNDPSESFETRIRKVFKDLKPLYKSRQAISQAKYKDLKKLCDDGVIPNRYHRDFLNLPFTTDVKDTLNQTDEEDSVEEE